jgi:hypothetical protein
MAKLGLILSLLVGLCACNGGATLVRSNAAGGRVHLRGGYMIAMADARELMAEVCRGRFVQEEAGDALDFRCVPRQVASR